MTLVFATECRFSKVGLHYYVNNEVYAGQLWERYLKIFDRVIVFARVEKLNILPPNIQWFLVSNKDVSFIDLPYFVGPLQYLKKSRMIKKIAKDNACFGRSYICRIPGIIGTTLCNELHKVGIPYAVEVVGDPWDVFAPGVVIHPLSSLFRISGFLSLRRIVKKSHAALYVTKYQLQRRYPVAKGIFSTNASNVILKSIQPTILKIYNQSGILKILAVGSLAQMYKSPDVAIESIALLKKRGVRCHLTWLGGGLYKDEMIEFSKKHNVENEVSFAGDVSSSRVKDELMNADLFLHISRTEGLPRAIIEAMGAGLPCIASRVGGIPELLDDIAMVNEIKPIVVADKIESFIRSSDLMKFQALRNIDEAQEYLESVLEAKRNQFYKEVVKLSK